MQHIVSKCIDVCLTSRPQRLSYASLRFPRRWSIFTFYEQLAFNTEKLLYSVQVRVTRFAINEQLRFLNLCWTWCTFKKFQIEIETNFIFTEQIPVLSFFLLTFKIEGRMDDKREYKKNNSETFQSGEK